MKRSRFIGVLGAEERSFLDEVLDQNSATKPYDGTNTLLSDRSLRLWPWWSMESPKRGPKPPKGLGLLLVLHRV